MLRWTISKPPLGSVEFDSIPWSKFHESIGSIIEFIDFRSLGSVRLNYLISNPWFHSVWLYKSDLISFPMLRSAPFGSVRLHYLYLISPVEMVCCKCTVRLSYCAQIFDYDAFVLQKILEPAGCQYFFKPWVRWNEIFGSVEWVGIWALCSVRFDWINWSSIGSIQLNELISLSLVRFGWIISITERSVHVASVITKCNKIKVHLYKIEHVQKNGAS